MSWKIVVLVAAAMTVTGIAFAGKGGSGGVTFCAGKGGDLTLGSKGKCPKGSKKVTIAKQGPQGPQGPQGEQGTPGKDGTPADLAPEAVRLLDTATGPTNADCVNTPGRFCGNPSGTCGTWSNAGGGNLSVGYRKDSGGWVHLQGTTKVNNAGACTGPAAPGIFYLPEGYRPPARARFTVPSCSGVNSDALVLVNSDGLVAELDTGSSCLSLDGVEFHP